MADLDSVIDAATLTQWLTDGGELALLDPREEGDYVDSHLFRAACVPLSSLELNLGRRVPRSGVRMVWCDDGSDGSALARRAAGRAGEQGYTNVWVLDGGTAAWAADGGELYSGVNVPSKAFGEHVEHAFDTPRIPAAELARWLDEGRDVVVLDSRPMGEYRNMSIPTGIDCPGAELVHRVKEVVTDPATTVVVNCAGRTRSIIGAQSLINAGLENRVVALENGTMGWELAGLTVEHGRETHAPEPGAAARAWSTAAAAAVGERFGVSRIDAAELGEWLDDVAERSLYLLDVRTPEEYEAGHLAGSRPAPGGQLVQATDEYVATWGARLVLIDDNGVRATMTASWLRQLGWDDVAVLDLDVSDAEAVAGAGLTLTTGRPPRRDPSVTLPSVPTISGAELAASLVGDGAQPPPVVLDLGSSVKFRRRGHVPGSWWTVRPRLAKLKSAGGAFEAELAERGRLIITSSDGQVARLAVPEAQVLWPDVEVRALAGGTKSYRHGGHRMVEGDELAAFDVESRLLTTPNDVWYKPYDHDDAVAEQHMRDYLTWEIALVDQLERDPTVSFPNLA